MIDRISIVLLTLSLTVTVPTLAYDDTEQQQIHQQQCSDCHGRLMDGDPDRLYTRDDRKINTRQGLNSQVRACSVNLNLQWFDDEIENMAEYLNRHYYRFDS